jgi:hypothetical protein
MHRKIPWVSCLRYIYVTKSLFTIMCCQLLMVKNTLESNGSCNRLQRKIPWAGGRQANNKQKMLFSMLSSSFLNVTTNYKPCNQLHNKLKFTPSPCNYLWCSSDDKTWTARNLSAEHRQNKQAAEALRRTNHGGSPGTKTITPCPEKCFNENGL